MLDQLNSEDDTGRIEQLEAELQRVRNAFEEYISTSEGLEVDVKKELHEMQKKLNQSASANKGLAKKLQEMGVVLLDLERSSKGTKERLKTESKERRRVERALVEAESELKNKGSFQIRNIERTDSSPLKIVDSGILTETVSNTSKGFVERELETVTEELITTQQILRKTEGQLKKSQTLVRDLKRNHNIEGHEASKNDKKLLLELHEIRAEIDAARNEIQSQSTENDLSKQQMFDYEKQLQESREENTRLNEEITCLRMLLYDQDVPGTMTDEKIASRDNATIDDKFRLQKEVDKLNGQLRTAKTEYAREMAEMEAYWKSKFQQEKIEKSDSEEVSGDNIIGIKFASEDSSNIRERVMKKKLSQAEKMLKQSEEECSRMMSEVLGLTKALYEAHQNGEEGATDKNESKRQAGALLDAWNEVEDKKKENMTLENSLISAQEEVRLLSEEISNMSSAFERAQEEYNSIVVELEKIQDLYEASLNEIDSNQNNAEISSLRAQFQVLNEKNEAIARHVRNVEAEVLSAREKHDNVLAGVEARTVMAEELQGMVHRVVGETDQKNQEVDELTFMMENRMRLTEKSVDMLEKEISVVSKSLSNTQGRPLELSELIKSQPIGIESNRILEVEKEQSSPHKWLADQHKQETDEKVKAAISATMVYLSASSMNYDKRKKSSSVVKDDDDKILDDILSVRTERTDTSVSEVRGKVTSVENILYQPAFEGSPRFLEKSVLDNTESVKTKRTDTSVNEVRNEVASIENNLYQSARKPLPQLLEIKTPDDALSAETKRTDTSVTEVEGTMTSIENNLYQSALLGSPRLLEINTAIEKLTSMSNRSIWNPEIQVNDDDGTISTTASLSSNSFRSTQTKSKYEEIIRKVANYNKSVSPFSEGKDELEVRGEVGEEERE